MFTVTERDATAGADAHRYSLTRVVEIGGRAVRARVGRDYYAHQSFAVIEVLADNMTWTNLADDPPENWWTTTAHPTPHTDAATELRAITDHLIRRAAAILTPPPLVAPVSSRLTAVIEAMCAANSSYGGCEMRLTPGQFEWAHTHAGPLRIFERPDGSVIVTKAHRAECPFLLSDGTRDCDEACYFD